MEGNNGENQGGNVVSPVKNPLEIPEILAMVLNRLDCQDMKNARSVSKLWRDNGIVPWRNDLAVLNVKKTTVRAMTESLNVNSKSKIKIHLFAEKPFKQYKLFSDKSFHKFPPLPAPEQGLFFWDHCGPILTYLDIANISMCESFEGLKWILSSCPNLEVLKFSPYKTSGERSIGGNINWESAVAEAAAETVVARKLKFLSLFSAEVGMMYHPKSKRQIFHMDALLARRFFNLMPSLKELETYLPPWATHEGLKRLNLGPVPLEKLFFRSPRTYTLIELEILKYFRELGTFQYLKGLGFSSFDDALWDNPSRLQNILKAIRSNIEEFDLRVRVLPKPGCALERIRSFNLFGYKFTNLARLSLHFQYERFENSFVERKRYFAFDFPVFRGTPNLEYFSFGCRPINHVPWLTRTLTAVDLEGNGGIPNWRLDDNGIERIDAEQAANDIEVENGDEDVFAPEGGETVLEKMKEFHFEGCFKIEALQVLGRMMPNLEALETILNIETFPAVFQVWGGNGGTLKNLKLLLLHEPQDWVGLISEKKMEFPQIKIVEAVGEENWRKCKLSSQ